MHASDDDREKSKNSSLTKFSNFTNKKLRILIEFKSTVYVSSSACDGKELCREKFIDNHDVLFMCAVYIRNNVDAGRVQRNFLYISRKKFFLLI